MRHLPCPPLGPNQMERTMSVAQDLNALVADVNSKIAALAEATASAQAAALALQNSLAALSAATTATPATS